MDNVIRTMQAKAEKMYSDVLTPLGARYQMDIRAPRQPQEGRPTILFLGNHSSGKSTFINYLLGRQVQKTGISPTDDGFTVITHGSPPEESSGPAAAMRPEIVFTELDRFGPAFLARLRLKILDVELLKSMTLVDSPGMIDAAGAANQRGYDFLAAVRWFAESADLILFFLDPEKPGTTNETITAFTKALSGMENKILILLNKADMFDNIRDFARDYGALCWNLSRVIQTKDVPEIFTTYIPNLRGSAESDRESGISLAGFDEAREEVIDHVKKAGSRRFDNVISSLHEQARRLDMHIQVCWDIKRRVMTARAAVLAGVFGLIALTVAAGYLFRTAPPLTTLLPILGGGILATLLGGLAGRAFFRRYAAAQIEALDAAFERIYLREFTIAQRDDLTARWQAIRDHTRTVLQTMGLDAIPARSPRSLRQYRRLQLMLHRKITGLRK